MFLQITFQIVQGGELVTLRRADVFVAGHVLHLAQVVCLQPVGDDAAAELRRIKRRGDFSAGGRQLPKRCATSYDFQKIKGIEAGVT